MTIFLLLFFIIGGINAFGLNSSPEASSSTPKRYSSGTSQKLALIEKAKLLDPILNENNFGSYADAGWSNRLGTVLTPVSVFNQKSSKNNDSSTKCYIYTADRPFYWNDIDVGGRMTVIELPSENGDKPDLWIHSPVALDKPLIEALDSIGNVKHVVSPNYEHVKYALEWQKYFNFKGKQVNMWACPGLSEKVPEVDWTGELPFGCRFSDNESETTRAKYPTEMWDLDKLQVLHIDCESVPILGESFFNEVIFYHVPSKSLLVTDCWWNYPNLNGNVNTYLQQYKSNEQDYGVWQLAPQTCDEEGKSKNIPLSSRFWKFAMDKIYRPIYVRILLDKKTFHEDIAKYFLISSDKMKQIETLIPCHGDVVRGSDLAQELLRDFFKISS